jgi:hypothetical protein
MIRTLGELLRLEYPNHRLDGDVDRLLSRFSAVGEFTSTQPPAGSASAVRETFGADAVARVVAIPPGSGVVRTDPEDTNSVTEVPRRRILVGALAVAIVAFVAVVVITAIVGAHPAVTIVSASFAAVLGAIEGAIIFGGARFAGDRAWDQENLPNHTIVVVAILGASEHDALEGCRALTRLGATKVRVVDDAGRWRLPNIYATPE